MISKGTKINIVPVKEKVFQGTIERWGETFSFLVHFKDEHTSSGLNGGEIAKLYIGEEETSTYIFSYSNGATNIKPTSEKHKDIVDKVVAFLEDSVVDLERMLDETPPFIAYGVVLVEKER